MIRVIIADDHYLVRQGIKALLEKKAEDIEVVGEAENGEQAMELVVRLSPDVLLMDIAMPRLSGIQAAEQVRALGGDTKVVILSMYYDETLVRQALRHGAAGYVLKSSLTEELLLAIRSASAGEIYLSPSVGSIVADMLSQPDSMESSAFDRLSRREREVLRLIGEGYTNNRMAQAMNISVKTVQKHRTNLMSKLQVHDVAGLVRIAIKHGLIFLD